MAPYGLLFIAINSSYSYGIAIATVYSSTIAIAEIYYHKQEATRFHMASNVATVTT